MHSLPNPYSALSPTPSPTRDVLEETTTVTPSVVSLSRDPIPLIAVSSSCVSSSTSSDTLTLSHNSSHSRLQPTATGKDGGEACYVYVDCSNILWGAYHQYYLKERKKKRKPFDLQVSKLDMLLRNGPQLRGGQLKVRFAGGSMHVGNGIGVHPAELKKEWQDEGYNTHFLQPVRGSNPKESGVDDMLHAQMLRDILETVLSKDDTAKPLRTLVLATGDGNKNSGRTTFVKVVEMALQAGWRVELWSWRKTLNGKFISLSEQFRGGQGTKEGLFLHYLDSDYDWLTTRHYVSGPPQGGDP